MGEYVLFNGTFAGHTYNNGNVFQLCTLPVTTKRGEL